MIDAITNNIPVPKRDFTKTPRLFVARSFDINKPGIKISTMKGGILGGAVQQGKFKVGDSIEIRPGYEVERKGQKIFRPLKTKVLNYNLSLMWYS